MCSEGEKRASGLKGHLFFQLLQPFPGAAGGEKKKARSCLLFKPSKLTKFWRAGTRQGGVGKTKMHNLRYCPCLGDKLESSKTGPESS